MVDLRDLQEQTGQVDFKDEATGTITGWPFLRVPLFVAFERLPFTPNQLTRDSEKDTAKWRCVSVLAKERPLILKGVRQVPLGSGVFVGVLFLLHFRSNLLDLSLQSLEDQASCEARKELAGTCRSMTGTGKALSPGDSIRGLGHEVHIEHFLGYVAFVWLQKCFAATPVASAPERGCSRGCQNWRQAMAAPVLFRGRCVCLMSSDSLLACGIPWLWHCGC